MDQKAVFIKPLGHALILNHISGTVPYGTYVGGFNDSEDVEGLFLDSNSSFEDCCEKTIWGSYGKEGNQPLRYRKVKDLEVDHLLAILDTQRHLRGSEMEKVIKFWLDKKQNQG